MSELGGERILAQRPAIDFLMSVLGYKKLTPAQINQVREGPRSAFLPGLLKPALLRLNPGLSDENADRAVRAVSRVQAASLIEANEAVYELLTRGMTVRQGDADGVPSRTVRFLDFDDPENNDFVVTEEYNVGPARFDLVVFVNGLPLVIGETKSPTVRDAVQKAVNDLVTYQRTAPAAFQAAQLLLGLARDQAVYGSIGAEADEYAPFPEVYPVPDRPLAEVLGREPSRQDVLLYSLLRKDNLLEFTRNLVAYEVVRGRTRKKVARYQQRIAIGNTVVRLRKGRSMAGRGGIIWHTQGSGKSLTMVWLAQKLRQESLGLGNPTLLIVTDRTDLDDQITATFRRAGFRNPEQARTVRHLRELLTLGNGQTILTTINKFFSREPLRYEGEDVFVLVDEAHRSQYKALAARMRAALPHATFIAFTGTPISKRDKSTLRTFGPYLHKYTIEQSVQDGATVPILYESRSIQDMHAKTRLDPLYDRTFAHLPPEARERIKARITTRALHSVSDRIREVALDIVNHYETVVAPTGLKAQVVASSKADAVAYHAAFEELGAPESVVVLSEDEKDSEAVAAHHLTKTQTREVVARFNDPQDPLKFLIVVDKLLTGFDAPIEGVMYLDHFLREHTLLQAIARVNRTYPGKTHGLIVDYCGLGRHLREALEMFDEADLGTPMRPRAELVGELEAAHEAVMRLFEGVGRRDYDALLALLEPEDDRAKFDSLYRTFTRLLDDLWPDPEALRFEADWRWLSELRTAAANRFRDPQLDWSGIAAKVRALLDENVEASGIVQLLPPLEITSPEFDEYVARLSTPRAKASEIVHAARAEIRVRHDEDPVFYGSLRKRVDELAEARAQERLDEAEWLRQLFEVRDEMRRGPQAQAERHGLSEFGFAVYGLLDGQVSSDRKAPLAAELARTVEDLAVIDWPHKEGVRREMRRALRRQLLSEGLSRDASEPIITSVLGVAATQVQA